MSSFATDLPKHELPEELITFLIPVTGKYLILPNVTVAEIIHYRTPLSPEDAPTWLLGQLEWRGLKVPMVSFEALNEEPFQAEDKRRNIAILNGINDPEQLPYFALLTQGPPRLLRIGPDEIATNSEDERRGPAETMLASANGEVASIPNLNYIEASIIELSR